MTTKIEQRKIDRLIKWLDEVSLDYACQAGGYPDDISHIPGYLVVAGLSDFKERYAPELSVWTEEAAIQWHDDVMEFKRRASKEDREGWHFLHQAIYECRPPKFGEPLVSAPAPQR